jgi:hypothetical protein
MEAVLDRTGDMQISLSLQETIRGAIQGKILQCIWCQYQVVGRGTCNGYVTTHEESLGGNPLVK